MCFDPSKYRCSRKRALSAIFLENVILGTPKIKLLGSFFALLAAIGSTLVPVFAFVVANEALRMPIRILVDF